MMRNGVKRGVMYVFVLLNNPGMRPDYFIATSKETKSKVKQYKTRGIIYLSSLKPLKYVERWDKI
jgi:hypothetical protein